MSLPPPPNYGYQQIPRRGPSCWALGGIGCLVIFVLVAVLLFVSVANFMKTSGGHQVVQNFNKTIQAGECVSALRAIYAAIIRYHEQHGTYPPDLKSLSPKYLAPNVSLHCGTDTNDSPSHVTYEYFRPTETTPKTAVVLRFTWNITIPGGNTTETQTMAEQVALDGTTTQTSTFHGVTTTMPQPQP